jgi:serine/threonine protein kinase
MKQIAHNDIKLSNFLVNKDFKIKLIDFELASCGVEKDIKKDQKEFKEIIKIIKNNLFKRLF